MRTARGASGAAAVALALFGLLRSALALDTALQLVSYSIASGITYPFLGKWLRTARVKTAELRSACATGFAGAAAPPVRRWHSPTEPDSELPMLEGQAAASFDPRHEALAASRGAGRAQRRDTRAQREFRVR